MILQLLQSEVAIIVTAFNLEGVAGLDEKTP